MFENTLFGLLMALIGVGLCLMCGALFQIARHGFQQAVVETSGDKKPLGSYLFYSALTCFVVALLISFFD